MNTIPKSADPGVANPAIAGTIKSTILLIGSVCVLCAAGCAWERVADIAVPPVESSQYESRNLTPGEAVQVLREVAAQAGLEIRGPIQQPTNYGFIRIYTA